MRLHPALLAAFILSAPAAPALAQPQCGARDEVVAALRSTYGEQLRASGMQSAERMIEVWVSEETGSWTVLVTSADGRSCIAGFGEAWTSFAPAVPAREVAG